MKIERLSDVEREDLDTCLVREAPNFIVSVNYRVVTLLGKILDECGLELKRKVRHRGK